MLYDETLLYLWVHYFGISADLVTSKTNLVPTNVKDSAWELHSPLASSAHINNHIDALLSVLEPHAEAIKHVAIEFDAGINAAIYYRKDFTPGLHLSKRSIGLLAKMGLSIDFDLYFLNTQKSA